MSYRTCHHCGGGRRATEHRPGCPYAGVPSDHPFHASDCQRERARKGGAVTSEAKAAAARANGRKGGRPKGSGGDTVAAQAERITAWGRDLRRQVTAAGLGSTRKKPKPAGDRRRVGLRRRGGRR